MNYLVSTAAVAVATPIASPSLAGERSAEDPIFATIEAHRKAKELYDTAYAEVDHAFRKADEAVGPCYIEVPSRVERGKTILAFHSLAIERAVPSEKHPRLYRKYNAMLNRRLADRAAIIEPLVGDEDEFVAGQNAALFEALATFTETMPTTVPGLLAKLIYAGELLENDKDVFDFYRANPLVRTLGIAAKNLAEQASG